MDRKKALNYFGAVYDKIRENGKDIKWTEPLDITDIGTKTRRKASRNEDDRRGYRKSCRTANKVINSSRSDYMKQRLAHCVNPDERWKAVKDILHMDNT